MTPEEKARVKLDRLFAEAGWTVVNRDEYEPTMNAVAIREALLKGNREAVYFGSPNIVRGKHSPKYQRNTIECPKIFLPLQYEK